MDAVVCVMANKLHSTKIRIVGVILTVVIVLAALEFASFLVWKQRSGDVMLAHYPAMTLNAENFRFDKEYGVIVPLPERLIVTVETNEYVDRFLTADVLGNGLGFFDDGIDEGRQVYAVAIGDSFTRGVGSEDNLLYGWVELVENKVGWIDILNLGNAGSGQPRQYYFYQKIAPLVEHQLVILSFFSGGDFVDNLQVTIYEQMLASLESEEKATSLIRKHLRMVNYRSPEEFLVNSPIPSRGVWILIKALEKIFPNALVPQEIIDGQREYQRALREYKIAQSPEIRELEEHAEELIRSADRLVEDGLVQSIYEFHINRDKADFVAKFSAAYINEMVAEIRGAGREIVVVIHPGSAEIYPPAQYIPRRDFDVSYPVKRLKELLTRDVGVLDLTKSLVDAAGSNGGLLYHPTDGHYTQRGYRVVATEIAEFLEGLLGPGKVQNQ